MGAMWSLRFLSSMKALAPLCLRAALGFSFFWMHGRDKMLSGDGWGSFDWGKAWVAEQGGLADSLMLYVAAWTEFLGGAALLLGLLTRWACVGLLCVMGYALFKVHAGEPYKVKELTIAYSAGLLALLFSGAGPISADRILFGKAAAGSGE